MPIRAGYDSAMQEYRLALTDPGRGYVYYRYAPESQAFGDFRLDVDARRVAGPTNGGNYGVVFRAQPQGSNRMVAQYNFFVTADGTFALNLVHADGTVTTVAPRTASAAINKGEVSNHLAVLCRGNEITLTINGQAVGMYSATLTEPGATGLYVANPANAAGPVGMEAGFKNLRVSAVSGEDAGGSSLRHLPPVQPLAASARTSSPEMREADRPRRTR